MQTNTCRRQQLSAADQVEIMRQVMREHGSLDPHNDDDFNKLYKHFTAIAEACGTANHGLAADCCGSCREDIRNCMKAWWVE